MLTKSLFIRLFIRKPCGKFELFIPLEVSDLKIYMFENLHVRKLTCLFLRVTYAAFACSRFLIMGRMIPRALSTQGVTILRPMVNGSVS